MLSASRWNRGKKFTGRNRPIRRRVTKLHDWFALVNKYFRGKIMRTSLPLTEIWPISDRFIKQKYYCITVHYRTVCTSENRLGQTVQIGTANSRTSGTIFGLCPMADAKLNPCRHNSKHYIRYGPDKDFRLMTFLVHNTSSLAASICEISGKFQTKHQIWPGQRFQTNGDFFVCLMSQLTIFQSYWDVSWVEPVLSKG